MSFCFKPSRPRRKCYCYNNNINVYKNAEFFFESPEAKERQEATRW
jgi:hypothetical protein